MNDSKVSNSKSELQNADVPVPSDLGGCHPLISKTRKALEKSETCHIASLLQTRQDGILNVTVTRASLQRALRIMQALITAAEGRGWTINATAGNKCCAIKIGDDELGIRMRERFKRFEISQTKGVSGYTWKQYRYEPTGLLTLEITDYVAGATRSEWHEGKRQTLEETLQDFVDGLAAAAQARIPWHRKLEENKQKWKEAETRRYELERRKERERNSLGRLCSSNQEAMPKLSICEDSSPNFE